MGTGEVSKQRDDSLADNGAEQYARRVLIVEDHPLVADATSELLAKKDGRLSIAVCHTAAEALQAASASAWHRIFLDLDVPGAVGLSLVREFVASGYASRSCVITACGNPELSVQVRALGLLGYIVKAIPVVQFSAALDRVLGGELTFPDNTHLRYDAPVRLTRRQQELLALLQAGLSSKRIAARLAISEGTINNHIGALFKTLRVANRAHAVARAAEIGYLRLAGEVSLDATEFPGDSR